MIQNLIYAVEKSIWDGIGKIEQFSIECRKTKTKVTKDTDNPANQSKLEAITRSRHEARENVWKRATIGFGFTSGWLRKWRESFKPINERSNAKPMQTRITFDTQVKTALYQEPG